ncbi:Hint domain-containing protein [Paracoccus sp. 1_MG-2023]|uniref:Hint domain-containing protein n=1 Tax=unclassified Paracoccus (in: a-proteobacteria) TaxID=2688777 RepID=UPI001C08475A|nr:MULTISPECIES: Hint domain-containing protein [unclassified Paracoccus (in: a-proteobacteria)]MBU2957493.1 Hint domain-containing protein [Paracoccus sp. C2R09]MDO6670167.1 Hint domain-containing protein [Paracoccus sp. 1_MG-2023]
MWFGNGSQINTNSSTAATQANASSIEGHTAVGKSGIKAVTLSGSTRSINVDGTQSDAFATTYNTFYYGRGSYHYPSSFTYAQPGSDSTVTSQITGFLRVDYLLTAPDGSTQTQEGVLIQMGNGDMFFRPSLEDLSDWDSIDSLHSVEVLKADPLAANVFAANISYNPSIFDLEIICFAAGTLIRTDKGETRIEDLAVGDLVWTRDNGLQPVRWLGRRRLSARTLRDDERLRPIRIAAGALGANQPAQDLVVSPQHRVLIRSAIAQRMFGTDELLAPAKHLIGTPGIATLTDDRPVTYCHILFDAHEVIMSNGALTESLYPGPQAIEALGLRAVAEIEAIFPGIMAADAPAVIAARRLERGARLRWMVERHAQKARPLVS